MTPLERAMRSINAAEECLMCVYTPQAQTAKGHLLIARLAVGKAIEKQQSPEATRGIPTPYGAGENTTW